MKNIVSASELYEWLQKNHSREEDLYEGDLAARLYRYPIYELKDIPASEIDTDEWETWEEKVEEFKELYKKIRVTLLLYLTEEVRA